MKKKNKKLPRLKARAKKAVKRKRKIVQRGKRGAPLSTIRRKFPLSRGKVPAASREFVASIGRQRFKWEEFSTLLMLEKEFNRSAIAVPVTVQFFIGNKKKSDPIYTYWTPLFPLYILSMIQDEIFKYVEQIHSGFDETDAYEKWLADNGFDIDNYYTVYWNRATANTPKDFKDDVLNFQADHLKIQMRGRAVK